MATQFRLPGERRKHDPGVEERSKTGAPKPVPHGTLRSVGLGLITGAADDDPSAIGTYATAGATLCDRRRPATAPAGGCERRRTGGEQHQRGPSKPLHA